MSSSTDAFCPQCAKINFDFFTKGWQNDQDNRKLPDISWTTFSPERCQFCRLLRHCLESSGDIYQPLQGVLRGVYAGHELQLYMDFRGTSRRLDYSIRNCKPTTSSCLNEGPQDSKSFDVNELKLWLQHCEIHECLPDDHSDHPLPEGFRLIDVKNDCIVQPTAHVKYCALSYVWGAVRQPELTSSNRLKSETKNFLKTLELPIPTTILDAMALCREIDCPYLWVDSLCIVQDSEDDKHRQISSMANVYSQSFLAIIAATGPDSNAGLAPYGNRGRNSKIPYLIRRSSNGSFVASFSPQIAAQEIARSAWASRGWTLQEYALSRRVLFFTGSYAFLRCESGLWCEDFGLGFSNCFEEDLKWDLPLPPFYRRTPDPDRHYSSTFSQMLAQFIRRDLRYEQDILNAFLGVLTRLEDSIGTHIWGLPSNEFGAALQWATSLPCPSKERVGFPSWSWAGWVHAADSPLHIGSFHDMYKGFDKRATDMSVLTCYTVKDDKNIHTVEKYNFERISLQLHEEKQQAQSPNDIAEMARIEKELQRHFMPQPPSELATYIELHSPSKPPLSHHIFLWASCATLYVDRPSKAIKHPVTWDLPIRIEKRDLQQIGSIRLKPKWRETEPGKMPFFVSTAGVIFPSDSALYPLQLKFKIILTKLLYNTKPPVYQRIQVSHTTICQSDWERAHPKSRFIALV
jgi:hypothetical protein